MFNLPQANSFVSTAELAALNDALRKSATVGYQTPAVTTGADNGSLSPLVPQSIENLLSSATYTLKELALWPRLPKVSVTNTVHEYSVIKDHGLDLDPFITEGSAGVTNKSQYERKSVRIKYLAERREVSDVGTLVGLVGSESNAIALETERGTLRLLQKLERSLFHSKESVNDIFFDGIVTQIENYNNGSNTFDARGKAPTPRLLQEILGKLYGAPLFGRPDAIYVEPRIHAELIKFAVQFGRHDQLSISANSNAITYGATSQINIQGPVGPVPVVAAPFLFNSYTAPASGSTTTGAPSAPTLTSAVVAADSASQFVAGDAGDYFYKVVAVNNSGYSAPVASAAKTIAAGDKVTLTIAQQDSAVYFKIYRTEVDGALGTEVLIDEVKATSGGATVWVDRNENIPNSSKIVFVQHDQSIMEFAKLLDFFRRPLAEVATTKPFLLMLFGAPIVKVPSKCWVVKNAKVSSTLIETM
jgi:hypothetical protein